MMKIEPKYMTITVEAQPDGLNLSMWMSTVDFWMSEKAQFPYQYTHLGDDCTWILHSNRELTIKVCAMITEEADRICAQQRIINERRKLANR